MSTSHRIILNSAVPNLKTDYGIINNKINIFCQFFISQNKERHNEIISCLLKNVNNANIDKIYLLNERIYTKNELGGIESHKIIQVNINKRLTYKDVFNYVDKNNITGFFCIINSDIFFDETLKHLHLTNLSVEKFMFAQLRFEFNNNTKNTYINKQWNDSQDTWIFHTNFIKDILNIIELFNFQLGMLGCDNKLLYLLHMIRFKIINHPYFIKTYHYHTSQIRTYTEIDRIPGPYIFVNMIGNSIDNSIHIPVKI
jgi:hypothetical protein